MRLTKAKTRLFHVIEEEMLNPPEAVMLFDICKHELQHNALYQQEQKKKDEKQDKPIHLEKVKKEQEVKL